MINKNVLVGLVLAMTCLACSSTRQSATVVQSGFLSDYDRLAKDKKDGGKFWANPGFRLGDYDAFVVPEVEIWISDSNRKKISAESIGMLATLYQAQAIEKLEAHGWKIQDKVGLKTATIQLALTELRSPNRVGNILTSLPIMTTPVIKLTTKATDVTVFAGEVSTEVKITDSSSGQLLAEAMDRRVGQHALLNMGSTWADVKDAMGIWTTRLAQGLSKM